MNTCRVDLRPDSDEWDAIELTDPIISAYSLKKFADGFSLMTAGYRDQLDPDDIGNPETPFNLVSISILGEAKARVFARKLPESVSGSVHIGGETRPHTQEFISILARIYAAHGFTVHLRKRVRTTPIWYSSFGTFYEGYTHADNLTASHSQYFKGGWKPLDYEGKQLVEEEKDIIDEVKKIVAERSVIKLAPYGSENIKKDFDIDEAYVAYLKTIISPGMLAEIKNSAKKGFKCAAYTLGGSMKATTEHMFSMLGIGTGKDGTIEYYLGEEDSAYHKVGQLNGQNFGTDPGKPEIYMNIGAQDLLLGRKADVAFIWDPDGDRFNMVTAAPASIKDKALDLGLKVEMLPGDTGRCIVYFTPNQIYFMLAAYRLNAMKHSGELADYDWFIVRSVSSTRSIDELVGPEHLPVADVCVGFKHIGSLVNWVEKHHGAAEPYTSVTGKPVRFGKKPRALIMYEESGGAALGGTEMIRSAGGENALLAIREKDGMQVGLFALSLAAHLYNTGMSFAGYYIETITRNKIKYRYFDRKDAVLYDESLKGEERAAAKEKGMQRRDAVMNFFKNLAEKHRNGTPLAEIRALLDASLENNGCTLSELTNICFVGDGTLLEFASYWFLLRASGTDAVLRYYAEGEDMRTIEAVQNAFMNIKV